MSSDDDMPAMIAPDENDPRIQAAITEFRQAIQERFPAAEFSVSHREDPEPGIYLNAIVDVDDLDEVTDPIVSRLVDMQVDEGLPVYVIAGWPERRILEYLRRQKSGTFAEMPTVLTS